MSPCLASLPAELQLAILCSAEDLDDASSFSHTCKTFHSLYLTYRKTIERDVITSSPVYEYDITLSKFLNATQDLAGIYLTAGRDLPEEKRPKESVLIDCMSTSWTKKTATDEVIGSIASRWRESKYLRQLYLDDVVAKEFQHFRAQFASKLSTEARAAIVEPGLTKSSHPKQCHQYGQDFKARFHKSLCLLSMAIASRNIAKVAVVDGSREPHPHHLKDLSDETSTDVYDMWSKESVVISGEKRPLSLDTRLDCLEVFDFLYLFIVRKVVPFHRLEDWIGQDSYDWPFAPMGDDETGSWYSFLNHCRWALHPYDLVDLIRHRAWNADANYPQDKREYMRVRSVFDMGADNDSDWYSALERSSIVHALLPEGTPYRYTSSEDRCWWDLVRLDIGPPFQANFRAKFSVKHKPFEKPRFNGRQVRALFKEDSDHSSLPSTYFSTS